jgi:Uma2 family endonuclease
MALPSPRLFTVDEYYRMAEVGILREDERVELIEGEILKLGRTSPWHASRTDRLVRLFILRLRDATQVHIKNPVRLSSRSEPVPDLALLRRHPDRVDPYRSAHPTPADILLLVEVADSSIEYDLGRKARLYARHGIPELWVLDQRGDRLVVHRDPTPRGYATVRELGRDDSIAPLAFPEVTLPVADLLA